MKKLIYFFFAISLFSFSLISCGDDGDSLVGNWKATSAKVQSDQMKPNMVTLVEAEYMETNIQCNPDGTAKVARSMEVMDGIFQLDETTNTLKFSSAPEDPKIWSEEYTIESQSSDEMTLQGKIDQKGSTVTLVLQKVKQG